MRLTRRMNDELSLNCNNCPMKGKCSDSLDFLDCTNVLTDRLATYEDAEEQGLLVRLPCKVGDTCYITQRYSKRIIVAMVSKITSYTHGNDGKEHEWLIHYASKDYGNGCVAGSDFGKTVFLNREKAEAVLKGGQEDASNT